MNEVKAEFLESTAREFCRLKGIDPDAKTMDMVKENWQHILDWKGEVSLGDQILAIHAYEKTKQTISPEE